MSNLQKVAFGAASDGSQGDSTRAAFTKDNANVDVLNAQTFLTSFATTLTAGAALTAAAHLGKRVNINVTSTQTFNLPSAASCGADGVILLRNLGTVAVTLAITAGSGDTIGMTTLNGLETAMFDTDGIHAWNVLVRGRGTSANETVNGNSTVLGNELLSTAAPTLTINDTSSTGKASVLYQRAGVSAWGFGNSGAANVFALDRFVSGSYTDSPLSVSNSTGKTTVQGFEAVGAATFDSAVNISGVSTVAAVNSSGGLAVLSGATPVVTLGNTGDVGCTGKLTSNTLVTNSTGTIGGAAIGISPVLSVTGIYPFCTRAAGAPAGTYWKFGGDASGSFLIGNGSGTGAFIAAGGTAWAAASDERLKNIVAPLTNALAGVNSLRTVKYTLRADSAETPKQYVGFIAQDVQAVVPECVPTDADGHLGVQYAELTVLLAAAIKELSAKVEALEARLN